jgi:hypothetical protein
MYHSHGSKTDYFIIDHLPMDFRGAKTSSMTYGLAKMGFISWTNGEDGVTVGSNSPS